MSPGEGPLIRAAGVGVVYPPTRRARSVTALCELSFRIAPGEFVAVIGCSGAGKSTLLRCLTGFVRPTAGRLCIAELDVALDEVRAIRTDADLDRHAESSLGGARMRPHHSTGR